MKLIRRASLAFREGTSDKVYEVDLCEVQTGKFVVNFRYGRRGATLKEGSKTGTPVPLPAAERVFADLVQSKVSKGYRDQAIPAAAPKKPVASPSPADQKAAILDALRNGRKTASGWTVGRAAWRAGELRLAEAAPHLVRILNTGTPVERYSAAWALGFCGDSSSLDPLAQILIDTSAPDFVRRIAREALKKLSPPALIEEFTSDMIDRLPPDLRTLAVGVPHEFQSALDAYFAKDSPEKARVLELLYLIDTPVVRPALLAHLRDAPMTPPWFRELRHIFKAAEFRRDAEVFGILAYRFEKEKPGYISSRYSGGYIAIRHPGNNWPEYVKKKDALYGETPRASFGDRTRTYMRFRVCRTLRKLGRDSDPNFVPMAVGVLLPYKDADAQTPIVSSSYDWRTRKSTTVAWDKFGSFLSFNAVLYANSPRYCLKPSSTVWRCVEPYRPGQPAPTIREEAFPHLWDARPEGLLHLLAESECREVHEFAVKAVRANPHLIAQLDVDVVRMLVSRPYDITVQLGIDVARRWYDPNKPDTDLLLALATSPVAEARDFARSAIDQSAGLLLGVSWSTEFFVALLVCDFADVRWHARQILLRRPLGDAQSDALVGKGIAFLLSCDAERRDVASDLAEALEACCAERLKRLELAVIRDLIASTLADVQEFGGRVLVSRNVDPNALPDDVVAALVGSSHENVRAIGLKLLGRYPRELLRGRIALILALLTSELDDVRSLTRGLVHDLAAPPVVDQNLVREGLISAADIADDPSRIPFVQTLAVRLLGILLDPEPFEGVHSTALATLRDDLRGWIDAVTIDTAFELVRQDSTAAQEAGGLCFGAHSEWAGQMTVEDLVELGRHRVKAVRESSWILFSKMLHRFQSAMNPNWQEDLAVFLRVLDTRWEDSREFFGKMLATAFMPWDLSTSILLALCDNPHASVRALGRDLLLRNFKDDDGVTYLLALGEHPAPDMQLFVSSYLEQYASGHPDRLERLRPYVLSVLSHVNRSRVAKNRVLAFLASEAERDASSARVVADILSRLSATIVVSDRATSIELLLAISRKFPEVPVPIVARTVEVRHAG